MLAALTRRTASPSSSPVAILAVCFSGTRSMATLKVTAGIQPKHNALPVSHVVLVGTKGHLASLPFSPNLAQKLTGVGEGVFNTAKALTASSSNVPLFLNVGRVIALPNDASRHNSPSNADILFRELKSLPSLEGITSASVVLFSPYDHVLAHVAAVARAFPLYSRKTGNKAALEEVSVEIVVTDQKPLAESDIALLQAVADNVRNTARLVDTPANDLHTDALTAEALAVADGLGANIEKVVIRGEDLKKQGFGGIYHVGKAAVHPPALVHLAYKPDGASSTYALVGKGIVYDTGGMQIKTKTGMPGMKMDMAGSAALLGAFAALVKAGFKENLHLVMCLAENNISPVANKPDDIITMLSGKTVEINNTDAEGRLVLADGVHYAKNRLNASVIIDMATLTGAQSYATGQLHAGLLTNSEEWETKAVAAGRASGDLVHPFVYAPDLHFGDLKSALADMKNTNLGKMVGPPSSVAGLFIASHIDFAADVAWLHVDIASPAFQGERATAYGVSLVTKLLGDHTTTAILQ